MRGVAHRETNFIQTASHLVLYHWIAMLEAIMKTSKAARSLSWDQTETNLSFYPREKYLESVLMCF